MDRNSYNAILIIKTESLTVIQDADIIAKLKEMGFTVSGHAFQENAPFILELDHLYDNWKK